MGTAHKDLNKLVAISNINYTCLTNIIIAGSIIDTHTPTTIVVTIVAVITVRSKGHRLVTNVVVTNVEVTNVVVTNVVVTNVVVTNVVVTNVVVTDTIHTHLGGGFITNAHITYPVSLRKHWATCKLMVVHMIMSSKLVIS